MKNSVRYTLLLLLSACKVADGDDYLSANSPLILWNGRPSFFSNGNVGFDWEGTGCSFSVTSPTPGGTVTLITNLTISSESVSRISVYINDYQAQNLLLTSSTSSYLIAAGLPVGVSNISIQYAIEPLFNANFKNQMFVQFVGFTSANNATFVQPIKLSRRIDIIGDSITAGSMYDKLEAVNGDLSLETGCDPWAPLYGYSQQYNWETYLCRYFRANCTTIAWSGGVLLLPEDCPGHTSLSSKYPYTWATDDDQTQAWDFSKTQQPDAVIIYLGTNDWGCKNMTEDLFTSRYVSFMKNITEHYANSPLPDSGNPIHFFCTVGVMSPTRPVAAVQAAIAQATALGISVSFLNMTKARTDGCGSHPGPIGHWEMALQAAPQIKQALGWL
jgi:hypothetical protein